MTYIEMQKAEAELKAATQPTPQPRGATKAQLAWRAHRFALCVNCGCSLVGHTTAQMLECSNARS